MAESLRGEGRRGAAYGSPAAETESYVPEGAEHGEGHHAQGVSGTRHLARHGGLPDAQGAGDSGASIVEYGGLLVIVALIVVAVRGLGLQGIISSAISNAVASITGGK